MRDEESQQPAPVIGQRKTQASAAIVEDSEPTPTARRKPWIVDPDVDGFAAALPSFFFSRTKIVWKIKKMETNNPEKIKEDFVDFFFG